MQTDLPRKERRGRPRGKGVPVLMTFPHPMARAIKNHLTALVRGAAKVMCHLMFGLVALTATALSARLC